MTAEAERLIRDSLTLGPVEGLPEILLYRANSGSGLGRMARQAASRAPPYWAFAWAGGAALARHVLDHPQTVAGRSVLDLGAGSGIAGIAAAKAGARAVVAREADALGGVAIGLNAAANGVALTVDAGEPAGDSLPEVDLVLAGDVFYSRPVARRMLSMLRRCAASGAEVLVGDPGRAEFPEHAMRPVASYEVVDVGSRRPATRATVYALDPPSRGKT